MANVKGTRRLRLAVGLICEKLEIKDTDIDAYAQKLASVTVAPKKGAKKGAKK